ncbi:DUF7619 domain-containing protein [Culicoidibacter larvae]|uniref:DUF11 domain-containing protein n=1 Tax=Culicoidibacter larvae TaxID=2579976 RepID=A0A5R8QG27_9FIRM|nr:DUF11 domain-containing protein [Culicoidibacter larvae]TLG76716.1 DUF11 domain-containing protein [Culicoidibacter larvae]
MPIKLLTALLTMTFITFNMGAEVLATDANPNPVEVSNERAGKGTTRNSGTVNQIDNFSNGTVYMYLKKGEKISISTQYNGYNGYKDTYTWFYQFDVPSGSNLSKPKTTVTHTRAQVNTQKILYDLVGTNANQVVVDVEGIYALNIERAAGEDPIYNLKIDIRDTSNKVVSGRIWSEDLITYPTWSDINNNTENMALWYQSVDGYIYKAEYNNINGMWSRFYSDGIGVTTDTPGNEKCLPLYGSVRKGETVNNVAYKPSYANDCKNSVEKNKIFIDAPAMDIPTGEFSLPNGEMTWLNPQLKKIDVSKITFTPDSDLKHSGEFQITIDNFQGQFEFVIDVNPNDGEISVTKGDIVKQLIFKYGEPTTFYWDGNDANGKKVTVNNKVVARAEVKKAGEIHFILDDVEVLGGGMSFTRLNGHESSQSNVVYWDDSIIKNMLNTPTGCDIPINQAITNLTGDISYIKDRKWQFDNVNVCSYNLNPAPTANIESFGDGNYIDTWSYEKLNNVNGEYIIEPRLATPILSGSKATSAASVAGGDTISYTLTYANIGNLDAENVIVRDSLSDSEFNGSTISNLKIDGVANSGDIRSGINIGTLEAQSTVTITFDVRFANPLPAGNGLLNNTASIKSDTTPEVPTNEVEIPTNAAPIIQGEKIATDANDNGVVEAGEVIQYTIIYTNSGNLSAKNVLVQDGLDDSEFNGSTISNTKVNGVATNADIQTGITIDELHVGETVTITFDVLLQNPLPAGDGLLANTATAKVPGIPEVPTNTVELSTDAAPHLVGEKTAVDENNDGKIAGGETVQYTIKYTNFGNLAANNIVIQDPLIDAEFLGTSTSNLTVNGLPVSGDIKSGVNVGTLAPGASVEITFDVLFPSPLANGDGKIFNVAIASGDNISDTPTNIVEMPTDAAPELIGIKQADVSATNNVVSAGTTINYSIRYTNIGNMAATGVIISDTLSDSEFIGATIENTTINGVATTSDIRTGIDVGDISSGEVVTITFNIRFSTPLGAGDGVVKNTASAQGTNMKEVQTNEVILPTDAAPQLIGSKSINVPRVDGTVVAGDVVSYTVKYTNIGNLTAENVVITDSLGDSEFENARIVNTRINGIETSELIQSGIHVGAIAPQASVVITFDVILADSLPEGDGKLSNIAQAEGTNVEITETNKVEVVITVDSEEVTLPVTGSNPIEAIIMAVPVILTGGLVIAWLRKKNSY